MTTREKLACEPLLVLEEEEKVPDVVDLNETLVQSAERAYTNQLKRKRMAKWWPNEPQMTI